MFRIESAGTGSGPRLIASAQLFHDDFRRIADELDVKPFRARKPGFVTARRAEQSERVETRWNGKETTATAQAGDWIVTNIDADGVLLHDADGNLNVYVIMANRFPDLYERATGSNEQGEIWRPRGSVEAVFLAGGFEIVAPWGEKQRATSGYLLDNGSEVRVSTLLLERDGIGIKAEDRQPVAPRQRYRLGTPYEADV